MAKRNYDEALSRVLAHEGGYTNHPSDPGGPTNWGITIYDARKYWKADATAADVRAMPLSVAKDIYRRRYWDAQRCDDLPAGVDYAVFDYGVNSGIGRSGRVLRRLLDLPTDTSVVNDAVIAAAARRDPKAMVGAICDERLRFLKGLKTWPTFGNGWGRRVAEVRRVALAMAGALAVTSVPSVVPAPGKGAVAAPKATGVAGQATAAGAAAAATGGSAWGWLAAHPAAAGLAALAVALAGAAVIWLAHQARQRAAETAQTAVPADLTPVPEMLPAPAAT